MSKLYEQLCNTPYSSSCTGTCNPTTYQCECPNGYEHQRTLIRLADCSSPNGFFEATMAINFIISILTVIYGIMMMKGKRAKLLKMLGFNTLAAFSLAIGCLVALIQGFSGRGFWVGWASYMWFFAFATVENLKQLFSVTFRSIGSRMKHPTVVRYGFMLEIILMVVPNGIALPIISFMLGDELSPTYDIASANLNFAINYSLFPCLLIAATPLTFAVTTEMIKIIDESLQHKSPSAISTTKDLEIIRSRMKLLRTINTVNYPIFMFLMMPIGVGVSYCVYRWSGLTGVSFVVLFMAATGPGGQIYITLDAFKGKEKELESAVVVSHVSSMASNNNNNKQ
jgi:hypothetical protein